MKIYKKDIRKIIEILESKEKELELTNNSNSFFIFQDDKLKLRNFTIPEEYQLGELTEKQASIIYPYINKKFDNVWEYPGHVHLYFYLEKLENDKFITNSGRSRNNSYFFDPEDYIEHVIKQDEHYKI